MSEEKKSTIKSIEYSNESTNNYGTTHYHKIFLNNGDFGSIGSKTKLPDKLKEGSIIDYTITQTERGNVIKLVQPQNNYKGGGGSNYKPTPYEHLISGMAVAYSKDLVVAGKVDIKDILDYSEKLYQWMLGKKIVEISALKEENKPILDNTGQSEPVNNASQPEKWLNVTDKVSGDYTKEWLNIQSDIKQGKIKQVSEVRQLYKVSKDVESQLTNLLRFSA